MRRVMAWVRGHKVEGAGLMVATTGAFALALYWFQPWKLVVDQRVEEAPPAVAAAPGVSASAPVARPRALAVIASGRFRSLEHSTTGNAKLLELPDGGRVLRLEDLRTSNGPELVVILSPTAATTESWTAYGKGDILTLGPLKGNIGSQNYALPPGVDLTRYRSAVVWCRRFAVAFGAAPLTRGAAAL